MEHFANQQIIPVFQKTLRLEMINTLITKGIIIACFTVFS